ncbi:MAG: IPT/TIG domain-containing protein [Dehalococcoidia bacterium]
MSSISRSFGAAAGQTPVSITGTGFSTTPGATTILFGVAAANNVQCQISTLCTANSPAGTLGATVDVTVVVAGLTSAPNVNATFLYAATDGPPAPTVSGLSPTSAPGFGAVWVTISGTGFDTSGGTTVKFGTATSSSVTCQSSSQCIAYATSGSGTVDVTASVSGQTSITNANDQFTYAGPGGISVSQVLQSSGPAYGGTVVSIMGSGFTPGPAGARFFFGPNLADPTMTTCTSTTNCTATTPPGPGGTTQYVVATVGGRSSQQTLAGVFQYQAGPSMVVQSYAPRQGPADGSNTDVIINGNGIGAAPGATSISFGTNAATINFCQVANFPQGSVTCHVTPPHGTGSVPVNVTSGGATTYAGPFTYGPTVDSLPQSSGAAGGGTSVSIAGTQFNASTVIKFAGVAASVVTCQTSTLCVATSPPGASISDVTAQTSIGSVLIISPPSPYDRFSYIPSVGSVQTPAGSADGNTQVTITGAGFSTVGGATEVTFGGVSATQVNCTSATQCMATSPPGTGAVDVQVATTLGGRRVVSGVTAADTFSYAPAATTLAPATVSAAGGSVFITGRGLTSIYGPTTVTFNGAPASQVACASATSCTAIAPPGAGTTSVVLSVASQAGAAMQLAYIAPPSVTSLNFVQGPASGGTRVTLTGSGFNTAGATRIFFGPAEATAVSCTTVTSCIASAPAESGPPVVNVLVYVSHLTSVAAAGNQFTYQPVVSTISPTAGSPGGTSTVTMTGQGFSTTLGATIVKFGSNAATNVQCATASSCTAVSPAGFGTVDVTVSIAGGTSAFTSADRFTYGVLSVQTQPYKGMVGPALPYQPAVALVDGNNTPIPSFTGPITMAIKAGSGPGTLTGTTTINAVAGVATSTNLAIDTVGNAYVLTATSPGATALDSLPFQVLPIPSPFLDGTPSPLGAQCILRQVAGLPATQNCPFPLPNGDINGDGNVTPLDAECVLRKVSALPATVACPFGAAPGNGPARLGPQDPPSAVSVQPAAVVVTPGSSTTVTLQATAPMAGIGTFTMDLSYDPTVVTPIGCTDNAGPCNIAFSGNDVRVVGLSVNGLTGTVALGTVQFQATGACGATSALAVSVTNITDPSGNPIATTTSNGQIGLTSGCVVMALGASPNPAAVYGQVQLTVTFTSYQSGCSDFSAGLVWWYDGGVLLSYGYPSGTTATLSAAFTSSGAHNLTATYDGGGGCPASSAPVYIEQVQ